MGRGDHLRDQRQQFGTFIGERCAALPHRFGSSTQKIQGAQPVHSLHTRLSWSQPRALPDRPMLVIMTNMRRCSVADAKAHLPELITDAERDGRETIIERRGRPVARIAPLQAKVRPKKNALRQFDAAIDDLRRVRWQEASATADLRDARGRLE